MFVCEWREGEGGDVVALCKIFIKPKNQIGDKVRKYLGLKNSNKNFNIFKILNL